MNLQPIIRTVLLAEDEYLIAALISEAFEMAQWRVLGPFPTVTRALMALDSGQVADVAILDVNLNGELVYPLADRFIREKKPVILTTGNNSEALPEAYRHLPHFTKPVGLRQLVKCVNELMAEGSASPA